MRTLTALVAALTLTALAAGMGHAAANPDAVDRPDGQGDQLVFYYDARPGFTTFLNLHNMIPDALDIQVQFYGPSFSSPLARTISIEAGGTHIIDVGALKSDEPALPAQFGVAIATPVNPAGKPVVTHGLAGNFTVANLLVHSAWGASAPARIAVRDDESHTVVPAGLGTLINGTTVRLQPIQPTSASLAVYDNPASLESPAIGGNQLIFVNFEDLPGETYSAQSGVTTWTVGANKANGAPIAGIPDFIASGAAVTDLATVAGSDVNGQSGAILFGAETTAAPLNRFVFFTETLGTFATGYLLPPKTF